MVKKVPNTFSDLTPFPITFSLTPIPFPFTHVAFRPL
jgi:hypothetical protein